ncbi:hypothetical protein CLU79DRAFT_739303 [Phycomyces nitens]|nr:hypothetical protein CLU79DRAFT_739303 [Phycomyces nitens]
MTTPIHQSNQDCLSAFLDSPSENTRHSLHHSPVSPITRRGANIQRGFPFSPQRNYQRSPQLTIPYSPQRNLQCSPQFQRLTPGTPANRVYSILTEQDHSLGRFVEPVSSHRISETSHSIIRSAPDPLQELYFGAMDCNALETAIFYAEKMVVISGSYEDILKLATAYYQSRQYERTLALLNKERALSRFVEFRYLAGLCAIALEKWQDALDYLGHSNPFPEEQEWDHSKSIRLEALMCCERGKVYLKTGNTQNAAESFKDALHIDLRCVEALELMVQHKLMDEEAEWDFITTLPYEKHCGSYEEFFRSIYMMKIRRFSHMSDIEEAQSKAERNFRLQNSVDFLRSKADTLLANSRFSDCLEVCQKIRREDPYYIHSIPTHATCLYELGMKSELYRFAQDLANTLQDESVTWYTVGLYNLYIKDYAEAKYYFRVAIASDKLMEKAWLGSGIASSYLQNYDAAIEEFTTCNELVTSSHLPYMYIGKQYMSLGDMNNALENLSKSYEMCKTDPFLLVELGVYYINTKDYINALEYLRKALAFSYKRQGPMSQMWEALWCNFGHTYRHLKEYDRAFKCFELAMSYNQNNPDIYTSMGIICHIKNDFGNAILHYQKAFEIGKNKNFIKEFLNKALAHYSKQLSTQHSIPALTPPNRISLDQISTAGDQLEIFVEEEYNVAIGKSNAMDYDFADRSFCDDSSAQMDNIILDD